jgi:hypothetical protein
MPLFELTADKLEIVPSSTSAKEQILERADLQRRRVRRSTPWSTTSSSSARSSPSSPEPGDASTCSASTAKANP